MRIKCDYCGSMVDDTLENCPNCGAALSGVKRYANGQPQTIEELEAWYQQMNLPPEDVTRFYIGKDVRFAKAFGIYKDANGDYVVYKNKADGTRAVRYQGSDEAYAVNELYQKLQEEIANQKRRNAERRMAQARQSAGQTESRQQGSRWVRRILTRIIMVFAVQILMVIAAVGVSVLRDRMQSSRSGQANRPREGYYSYDGNDYYYQSNNWYYYDDELDDWGHTVADRIPSEVVNDIAGTYHIEGHEGQAFEDTFWYHEPTTSSGSYSYDDYDDYDSGWDDDDDWDSGWDDDDDWDSGYSDWDSDW